MSPLPHALPQLKHSRAYRILCFDLIIRESWCGRTPVWPIAALLLDTADFDKEGEPMLENPSTGHLGLATRTSGFLG